MDMAEEKDETKPDAAGKDQVALELMKFITVTTGYGKGAQTTGFTSANKPRTPDEHADALLQLFERCRAIVHKPVG
jgi:hypothetical protein